MPTVHSKFYPLADEPSETQQPQSASLQKLLKDHPELLTPNLKKYLANATTKEQLTKLEKTIGKWVAHRPAEGELDRAVKEIIDKLEKAKTQKGADLTVLEIKEVLDSR